MKSTNAWSGGQYSVYRVLLGVHVLFYFLLRDGQGELPIIVEASSQVIGAWADAVFWGLGLAMSLLLILGKGDRVAGFLLFFLFPLQDTAGVLFPILHPLPFLMLVHMFMPQKPYGSMAMIGRPDPDGGWTYPSYLYGIVWLLLVAMTLSTTTSYFLDHEDSSRWIALACGVTFSALSLRAATRPIAWIFASFLLILLYYQGLQPNIMPYLLLLLAAFDPGWLPPQTEGGPEMLFYDGSCGLCHRACRFVLAEDARGRVFNMAPLQGDLFQSSVDEETRNNLPDSLVIKTSDGKILTRSTAVLAMCRRLGGFWRPIGTLGLIIPAPLRDGAYSFIASIRHRLFKKPDDVCPVIPVHLRNRFLW